MNPYQVLGINKYSSKEEIRLAYKRLMRKHHPDTGDGNTSKLNDAKSAYIRLKDNQLSTADNNLTVGINVTLTQKDLVSMLGQTRTFEYEGVFFDVLVPYETRMNDTITVKDILPEVTLKIKFKERNE
jgi:hypothetical protein